MANSTIAIIVFIAMIALFAADKLPMAITALLGMMAMVFTGVISVEDAFSGMSSTATLMLIGFSIISNAFFKSGLSEIVGRSLCKLPSAKSGNEKIFIVFLFVLAAALSAFFNGLVIVLVFMPILESVEAKSGGRISRKQTVMPLAFASVLGGNLSTVGSTSMITAAGMYAAMDSGRAFYFWEPMKIGAAGVIAGILVYLTFGHVFQKKVFDFDVEPIHEAHPEAGEKSESEEMPKMKKRIVIGVIVVSVVFFCMGYDVGMVSMCGAVVLIITKCVDFKSAFEQVDWQTVFTLVGVLGFAKGISDSGAGKIMADGLISLCGPIADSPYIMCVIILFIATVLSNFMSNNATVAVLIPIAAALAAQLHSAPLAFVLACAVGANLSLATPICTACVTVTVSLGYRFKDYVKVGGMMNLLAFIATAAAIKFFYF